MPSSAQLRMAVAGVALAQRFQSLMAETLAEYLAGVDLLGRLHVMQEMKLKTGATPRLNTLSVPPVNLSPQSTQRTQRNLGGKENLGDLGGLGVENDFADTTVLGFRSVPFDKALSRIRNLTSMTRAAFDGLKARYRQQAFTIAGISDVRLIEQIQKELERVVAEGGTLQDFERAVDRLTSEAELGELAENHVNTVFSTNLQRAYANGRFEQMKDPFVAAALPFWKYITAGDGRVRPQHAALDGFVARQDDFVWGRIYPPLGFNCRCTVVAILASEAPDDAAQPGSQRLPAGVGPDDGFSGGRG